MQSTATKTLRGAVLFGPHDVRFAEWPEPQIQKPTDVIVRNIATCVCGSDLWDYRGIVPFTEPRLMGHEYCGIVEETGNDVATIKPGDFVVGSFDASDNTCPNCLYGYQSACVHGEFNGGAQAPRMRVAQADGTLIVLREKPSDDLVPDILALSDVCGTGWYAAVAANVQPGGTVVVVGDGAVGLLGVLAAKELGAERIIAMSGHKERQMFARDFGATDVVEERGDSGAARIKEMTKGIGADSVLECVGTQESMMQAIHCTRQGGWIGAVGLPHGVNVSGEAYFFSHVHLHGGPAPVRRFLPDLMDRVLAGKIHPGKVFDLKLPLAQVDEAYRAMSQRRAIKVLLWP